MVRPSDETSRDKLKTFLDQYPDTTLSEMTNFLGITMPRTSALLRGLREPLRPDEIKILTYMGIGLTNREIAERLGRNPKTLKNQTNLIFAKLGVKNRSEAVGTAAKQGHI